MTISQDLHAYGITNATEILHNPSYDVLFNETTLDSLTGYEKGVITECGAVASILANSLAAHLKTNI